MKTVIRGILLLACTAACLIVGSLLLARGAWALGNKKQQDLPEVKRTWTAEELQQQVENGRVHRVSEWPADKPLKLNEAPQLKELVAQGKLPPVEQRVGEEPLVIHPPDQNGPYGGTFTRYVMDADEARVMGYRMGYERLFRFDPMGNKFVPNLALWAKTSDGGKTWIVRLRKGVKWSDGHPWGADDLMFWYNDILCNKKLRDADLYLSLKREYMLGGELFKLEKIDDHTVRFRYAVPNGLFMLHMTYESSFMLTHQTAAHHFKKLHPDFCETKEDLRKLEKMASEKGFSGPYHMLANLRDHTESDDPAPTLEAWVRHKRIVPGDPVVFTRNPYYWKVDPAGNQLPYMDEFVFLQVANRETLGLKAINGQVNVQARHLDFQKYTMLMEKAFASRQPGSKTEHPFSIRHWVGPATVKLTPNLNHRDPVLRKLIGDVRFRKAMSYAINRDEVNQAQFLGIGTPRQPCPTAMSPYYSAKREKLYIEYDPALANSLLDEMGLTERDDEGFRLRPDGKTLRLNIDTNDQTGYEDGLYLVTQYWRAIGIKSDLKIRSRALCFEHYSARKHDVDAWWYAVRAVPLADNSFPPRQSRNRLAGQWGAWFMSNGAVGEEPSEPMKEAMNLWRKIELESDFDKQAGYVRQMYDIMGEQCWTIGLVGEMPIMMVVQDRFRNVPEVAYYDWCAKGPGNTAPECWAIEE